MSKSDSEFAPDDPLELVPAVLETPMDDASLDLMARALVEEYMLLGFSDQEIAGLFHNPLYRATHNIQRAKGASYVMDLIKELRNG